MVAPLIDEFLPVYEFDTHHEIDIDAPIEDVYSVVRDLDLSGAALARILLWLRNVPARLRGERGLGLTLEDLLGVGFILLADEPPGELVLGFVGEFWTATGNLKKLAPSEFRGFAVPGYAKAVMNFRLTALDDGRRTRLATDSRAQCLDDTSRRKFRRYMFLTNRLRGVLRSSLLRACKHRAESRTRDGNQ
jgi:hypothetical protein